MSEESNAATSQSAKGTERCDCCRRKIENHGVVILDELERRLICPEIRRAFGEA